jgi:hypothetical protein
MEKPRPKHLALLKSLIRTLLISFDAPAFWLNLDQVSIVSSHCVVFNKFTSYKLHYFGLGKVKASRQIIVIVNSPERVKGVMDTFSHNLSVQG